MTTGWNHVNLVIQLNLLIPASSKLLDCTALEDTFEPSVVDFLVSLFAMFQGNDCSADLVGTRSSAVDWKLTQRRLHMTHDESDDRRVQHQAFDVAAIVSRPENEAMTCSRRVAARLAGRPVLAIRQREIAHARRRGALRGADVVSRVVLHGSIYHPYHYAIWVRKVQLSCVIVLHQQRVFAVTCYQWAPYGF